jgi:hypothetical protein
MAYGNLLADVVQSSVTGTPPQFNDGTGTQTGTLCRAWVNFNGTSGASPVIRASFNISSVTRSGTGYYTIAFTNSMSDANYSVTGSGRPATGSGYSTVTVVPFRDGSANPTTPTASSFTIATPVQGSTNGQDSDYVCLSIFR